MYRLFPSFYEGGGWGIVEKQTLGFIYANASKSPSHSFFSEYISTAPFYETVTITFEMHISVNTVCIEIFDIEILFLTMCSMCTLLFCRGLTIYSMYTVFSWPVNSGRLTHAFLTALNFDMTYVLKHVHFF